MEHTSDMVTDGRLIHELSYAQRAQKQRNIEISALGPRNIKLSGKVDFFDADNKIIYETKRSNNAEISHEWQAKFYIWLFELNGISGVTAVIEYPTLRRVLNVIFNDSDRFYLEQLIPKLWSLINAGICPSLLQKKICRQCSYYEFCYSSEK